MRVVVPSDLAFSPTPCFLSPQERSPSPAPTAVAPSQTAPTCGRTSRRTRTSRSTSARRAPGPSPACPCSTSTKSRAARGAPADPQVSFRLSRPSPAVGPPHNSGRKDPHVLLATMEFPSELRFWPCWPHRMLRTIFKLSLKEAFLWTFLWTADGRVACSGDPSHCPQHSGAGLSMWVCVSKAWI